MNKIYEEAIIEGKGIGEICIGMSIYDFEKWLSAPSEYEELDTGKTVLINNVKLWFDKNEKLYQIMVFGNFKGKFKDKIGLGSTMLDIERFVGEYEEEFDTYVLKDYKGICFELEDIDEWDEKKAPIESISVYQV